MSEIKQKTLEEGAQLVKDALLTHMKGINEGYIKSGETDFSVSLKLKIEPDAADGDFNLQVKIDYTKEKVTDTFTRKCRDSQPNLFDEQGTGERLRCPDRPILGPDGKIASYDQVYASFCNNKCELRCVASLSEPNEKGEQLEQGISCAAWADRDHMAWLEAFLQDSDMWIEDNGILLSTDLDLPWVTSADISPEMFIPRTCRVCGCTDDNACEGGCSWVPDQPDLCTACAKDMEIYRLQNKYNGNWWEGPAESPEKAYQLAGSGTESDYNIKVKTKGGGWGKPKRRAA